MSDSVPKETFDAALAAFTDVIERLAPKENKSPTNGLLFGQKAPVKTSSELGRIADSLEKLIELKLAEKTAKQARQSYAQVGWVNLRENIKSNGEKGWIVESITTINGTYAGVLYKRDSVES